MTHTPTPWKPGLTRGNHGQVPVRGGDEDRVCLVDEQDYGRSEGEAYDNADRIVAALNFFHGRDIPTERIKEGDFWKMLWLLRNCAHADAHPRNRQDARDFLYELGIEP